METNGFNINEVAGKVLDTAKIIGKDVVKMQYGIDIDEAKQHYIQNTGNSELAYADLCKKMNTARTNVDYIEAYEGFAALHGYSDSWLKAKECLDKLTFNTPEELRFLGVNYLQLGASHLDDLGNECIRTSIAWRAYEDDYAEFYKKYDNRPKLLKLWDKFSTLIIIIGIVTLLSGFAIYFGAVLIEFILRGIFTTIKRNSDTYKKTLNDLKARKNEIDKQLARLRSR